MGYLGSTVLDRRIEFIGVANGYGSPDPRCARAPDVLARSTARLRRGGDCTWRETLRPAPRATGIDQTIATLAPLFADVAEGIAAIADAGNRFIAIGGDHSCAIGTWSGAAHAYGRLGLVWIDAHMDSHTPATTATGNLHGMPLASLLGEGDARLTGLAPGGRALDPRHVCLIGARSFEPEEPALLARLGVRVIDAAEVARRGFTCVLAEAVAIASGASAGFGVSFDLDALDPREAPGVSVPEAAGLAANDVIAAIGAMAAHRDCHGLEVVEYNPACDPTGATRRIAERAITTFVRAGADDDPDEANRSHAARRAR